MTTESIFCVVDGDFNLKVGLPPNNKQDTFLEKASTLGTLKDASHFFFNIDYELYVVHGSDIYTGPLPSTPGQDWFSTAKRVGKDEWDRFKFLCSHPSGCIYAVTKTGEFYRGPVPDNEDKSWIYGQATVIGIGDWNTLLAFFFDLDGILYAVTNDGKLLKGNPPNKPEDEWIKSATVVGGGNWKDLTHFMSFGPKENLWCVSNTDGTLYKGTLPSNGEHNYIEKAENLGSDYHKCKLFAFTRDTTIKSITSLEFLPSTGKTVSQAIEVLEETTYDNKKGSDILKNTFSVNKTFQDTSFFGQEHGFTAVKGTELFCKAGIPHITQSGCEVSIDTSKTHNWNFTKNNEIETTLSKSYDVQVEPGKSVRVVASAVAAKIQVVYSAKIQTQYGYDTTIHGKWIGITKYNLHFHTEDHTQKQEE